VDCFFLGYPNGRLLEYAVIARHAIARRAIAFLSLIFVLAACAGAGAAPPPPDATAPAGGGGITLVLWHGWSGDARQALSRLADQFNRQHPDGRVSLQSIPLTSFDDDLRSALNFGGGPHMMLIPNTWVGSLAVSGALLPLDDLITPAEQGALLPAALGGARARGQDAAQHLYGVPVVFDTLALFYDKRNVLTPPEDTDRLLQSAHGLSAPGATPARWGLAFNLSIENTIGYLYAAGGRVFDDQGGVVLGGAGREGAERWLAWLFKLQNDQQILARSDMSIQIDRELKDGHALMALDWAHQLGLYRSLWGDNLGVAPLPRLSATNQPPQPYVQSDVLAINGRVGASERQIALDFARFMVSDAAQAELLAGDLQPAQANLTLDGERAAWAQAFRAIAQAGLPMPNVPTREREIIRRELAQMQRQVLRGEAAPAEAVTEADTDLREQLALPKP
jgi:ABC-type glycerol-3-phosphate transport system substrate-binding protein